MSLTVNPYILFFHTFIFLVYFYSIFALEVQEVGPPPPQTRDSPKFVTLRFLKSCSPPLLARNEADTIPEKNCGTILFWYNTAHIALTHNV